MYCFNYNTNPETGESYIFSALDTEATREDFEKALQDGVINENWKNLLVDNVYTSDSDAPKMAYWKAV